MAYNYETVQLIMDGADILYGMLRELTEGIRHLPGCKMTANLKRLSANISTTGEGVYQTMHNSTMDAEPTCAECADNEYAEADIPSTEDLNELMDAIIDSIFSGKPISISADIHINDGNAEYDDDTEDIE